MRIRKIKTTCNNRAKMRGEPLEEFCKKADTTTHEYGPDDHRIFCHGLIDPRDGYPCDECRNCGAYVGNARPLEDRTERRGKGFMKGTPSEDGRYFVLIRWGEGCNVEGYDYTLDVLYFINGSWYEFAEGNDGMPCTAIDGGTDYEILGWRGIEEKRATE